MNILEENISDKTYPWISKSSFLVAHLQDVLLK